MSIVIPGLLCGQPSSPPWNSCCCTGSSTSGQLDWSPSSPPQQISEEEEAFSVEVEAHSSSIPENENNSWIFLFPTFGLMETLQARNLFSMISSCFLSSSSSPVLGLRVGWSRGASPASITTCLDSVMMMTMEAMMTMARRDNNLVRMRRHPSSHSPQLLQHSDPHRISGFPLAAQSHPPRGRSTAFA